MLRRHLIAVGGSLLAAPRSFGNGLKKENRIVFREAGRYGGWPANHGIWAWHNEVVVGFTSAWYKPAVNDHAVDRSKKFEDWQARSPDGGETWRVEKPNVFLSGDSGIPKTNPLRDPLDFAAPDFAFMFGFGSLHNGPSWFYTSNDRCKTWSGPYTFAVEGIDRICTRTDLIVLGRRDCIMLGSAAKKSDGKEGRIFCARTTDGGLTWKLMSLVGPEPDGYMIMPSTLRLGESRLLTAIRHKDPAKPGSIDMYLSEDLGKSWKPHGDGIPNIGGGNPPALVKMRDGRLSLTYGYRAKPWGVRARISQDQGRTWGEALVLRDDALTGDLGYPRAIQRPDGKMLSIYYFNGPRDEDRTIQATIWEA